MFNFSFLSVLILLNHFNFSALEFLPNEEAAAMIMSMGFERNHVIAALKATENNLDRALDWIMSHGPEEILPTENTPKSQIFQFRDGKGSK